MVVQQINVNCSAVASRCRGAAAAAAAEAKELLKECVPFKVQVISSFVESADSDSLD